MNPFHDLVIKGYAFEDMEMGVFSEEDVKIKSERDLIDFAFASVDNQVHLTLTGDNAKIPASTTHYVFMIDTSRKAIAEATGKKRSRTCLGVCTMGRVREDGRIIEHRTLLMEDLDTAHLYDRYQSALVAWHAESFGEGPQSEAGQAAIAAGALAGSTPKAKVGRRKDRRL